MSGVLTWFLPSPSSFPPRSQRRQEVNGLACWYHGGYGSCVRIKPNTILAVEPLLAPRVSPLSCQFASWSGSTCSMLVLCAQQCAAGDSSGQWISLERSNRGEQRASNISRASGQAPTALQTGSRPQPSAGQQVVRADKQGPQTCRRVQFAQPQGLTHRRGRGRWNTSQSPPAPYASPHAHHTEVRPSQR